jgi:hypothetical protein
MRCWKERVSELEEYLLELFLDKLNAALEGGELNFAPDEISHIVSLAIELGLTGAHRVHGVN